MKPEGGFDIKDLLIYKWELEVEMNWMEAHSLVLGIGAFVVKLCLPEKNKEKKIPAGSIDPEVIRKSPINKRDGGCKTKVTEVVDERHLGIP